MNVKTAANQSKTKTHKTPAVKVYRQLNNFFVAWSKKQLMRFLKIRQFKLKNLLKNNV